MSLFYYSSNYAFFFRVIYVLRGHILHKMLVIQHKMFTTAMKRKPFWFMSIVHNKVIFRKLSSLYRKNSDYRNNLLNEKRHFRQAKI